MKRTLGLWIVAAGLCAAGGSALAQNSSAGNLIVVVGEVRIVGADGATRAAQRGDEVREGDTIVTGASGLAQIRMSDRAAISVRADSQLRFDAYKYSGEGGVGSSLLSLLAGGFRTITGLIARGREPNYRVRTENVTIGVRGTHFEVVHVLKETDGVTPGTYNRVYDGLTTMQTRTGAVLQVARDQTGFVALTGKLTPVLVPTPPALFRKPAPVPIVEPQSRRGLPEKAAPGKLGRPLLNPLDAPRTGEAKRELEPSRLTPLSPSTTTIAPKLSEPTTTDPTKIESTTTILSPTTTTISPTTTTIESTTILSPTKIESTTTILSPTTTTISPTTTTISPTTTTISPTTTTISPTLTSPTTTTIKR